MHMSRLFISLFALSAFIGGMCFFILQHAWIDLSILTQVPLGKPSVMLDDQGNEWARFALDKRAPVPFTTMPQQLVHAFLAAEDHNFFKHQGISYRGIIRSIVVNVSRGKMVQGASTITQQLVRLLFFDQRKTFSRKIKEQIAALLVERYYTKEQILEAYLNHVCFGCGIYGVEAACKRFWNKSVHEITITEAAVLAGIVRSPANYCPLTHKESAQKRRNIVLRSMYTQRYINFEQYQDALKEPVILAVQQTAIALHLKEALRLQLEDIVGRKKLYEGGLIIQTTLNQEIQKKAEQVFSQHITHLRTTLNPLIDGALLSLNVSTGEIKAVIGGFDFNSSKFNRALQAQRQIGSIFKPIIYAAGLQAGLISFDQVEVDEPVRLFFNNQIWSPNNYNNRFEGPMTLAAALSYSNNSIAVKTLMHIGIDSVIKLAEKMRISGTIPPYPSLALGCLDRTLVEITGMFNVFANSGIYVSPHALVWIKDSWGTKIWRYKTIKEPVISLGVSSQINKVLSASLVRLKRKNIYQELPFQAFGKSGTTNDCRTCWFIGSTPTLTTGIYIGCDDNRSLGKNVFPLRTALPIWHAFNLLVGSPIHTFVYDPTLEPITIDERTGRELDSTVGSGAITILLPKKKHNYIL